MVRLVDPTDIWLRVYIPGEAILQGKYTTPPVAEVR